MLKLKFQYFGHLMRRADSLEKTLMLGKIEGGRRRGRQRLRRLGWHHQLNGHEFEQALEIGDGQGSLVCCSPWGRRVGHNWVTNTHTVKPPCHCYSVTKWCPTLFNPDRRQAPLSSPFSSCLRSFPASGSFPMSWLFTSSGQSIEASASASVLPMIIQGWSLLEFTDLISLQSKGLSRVFSNTTVQKHQFFGY